MSKAPAGWSPVETARRISRLHHDRDYRNLEPLLGRGTADGTLSFLRAVDQVIDAHDRLQAAARTRFGRHAHRAWNIDALANNLGVFSRDVRIISQSFHGDRAVVTLQAGDALPLDRAEFARVDGAWRLTEGLEGGALIPSLEAFAARIDDVARRVSGGLTPMGYYDAVTQELMPQLISIARFDAEPPMRVTDATRDDE